ncbi:hypothetical protein SAMN05877809_1113 [Rhodobacter sp. JA431]|uniref:hypothetical protein n=1 Tax=Rhodobacter sp. JA431 TaxID=570013 RepID=UPI000BD16F44|nr:hypothetical protein [Rhodobacter sp. JA431]SOC19750.1 hypothetical protein SAMN05877809_1113 [Rhodobacter sp. JA431]
MKTISLAFAACLTAVSVHAGPFDGVYHPAGETWDCRSDQIGGDGGAVAILGEWLEGVESRCQLTQPTPVRDMKAVLYDAVCSELGETTTHRLMILSHDRGVYLIRDGYVSDWRFCP